VHGICAWGAPEDLEALEETLTIVRDAATMNRLAESDAEDDHLTASASSMPSCSHEHHGLTRPCVSEVGANRRR
jgi:hypothetical protein